ncbi:hypothetical protein [Rhizobium mongolense]|uniref:Uncharacterized protein n=1 Tax=Rhizobium mongolense TaxID=57676 RepID=A0A7W6RH11_9HYPH|nr:hypothetical protein [Rhizobium mongolense]MBB4272336.1 hypothetical protein [Rhizobium mongolense]
MLNKDSKFPGKDRSDKGKWIGPWMPQWRDQGDTGPFTTLQKLYGEIQGAPERIRTKRAELEKSGKYTPAGIKEMLKQVAINETVPDIRRAAAQQVRKFRREIDGRRAAFKPFEHDPADIVGEMRRQEVRRWLLTLEPDERTKAVRHASDPFIVEAAISVPVEITGLLPSTRDHLSQLLVEQRYGPEMEGLNELDEAVKTVERAVDGARDDVREILGMLRHDFDAEFKPIEQQIDNDAEKESFAPPPIDVAAIAAQIKALQFQERHQLIDLALERQTAEHMGEDFAKAFYKDKYVGKD